MKKRPPRSVPPIQLLDKGEIRLETEGGNLAVAYRLARSSRARYLRLTINRNNEVVLTLPAGCSLARGLRFMKTKTGWLQRHLARVGPPLTLHGFLLEEKVVAVHGRLVTIEWQEAPGRAGLSWRRNSPTVAIRFDPRRHTEGDLKSVLRQFAAEVLLERTLSLAASRELAVRKVSVRDQISRWGSCSAKKNISLNWRLLLLPPEIQDYVIWHELSHLIEMNHSRRFWNLLQRYDPGALQHDAILSQLTNRIMALGRVPQS